MKTKSLIVAAVLIVFAVVMAILLRGSTQQTSSPTVNSNEVQTAAVNTFTSNLTQTAIMSIPTKTPTLKPTVTTPAPITVAVTEASATATPSCYHLRWIKDITIPDYSKMNPGEAFTKTWEVINNGTCAWRPGFRFALYGGDPMGGSNYTLTQTVNPGQKMDLSIAMTVPNGSGIVISTWRMSDETGWFFGDALRVVIDLGGETPTP